MALEEGTSTSTDIHDVKQSLSTQTDTSISIEEEEPSSLDDSFNTAAEARRNNQPMGTKPKQSNLSLLSQNVAHATLERCLLGRNGGETVDEKESRVPQQMVVRLLIIVSNAKKVRSRGVCSCVFYSLIYPTRCSSFAHNIAQMICTKLSTLSHIFKGHIIDILELRRLSSRGVPDEPPSESKGLRSRAVSAPAVEYPSTPTMESSPKVTIVESPSSPELQIGGNLANSRSYRPLVWRVLLGYLPPQTSLWNESLSRDRKLYDTLVNELFSSTCPKPHDVYSQEELEEMQKKSNEQQQQQMENEVYNKNPSRDGSSAGNSMNDDENLDEVPSTPKEEDETTNTTAATTPLSPGLLSARMQQEWVRGEDGENTTFDAQQQQQANDNGCTSPGSLTRLSPMCAMNTPRTRIRKEVFQRNNIIDEEEDDGGGEAGSDTVSTSLTSGMESLLLPDDDDKEEQKENDEEEEDTNSINLMNTVSIESGEDGSEKLKAEGDIKEDPLSAVPLTRSISITKTASEDENTEGLELCRQSSRDIDDDTGAIHPHPESSIPDTDEEENVLLLDEIRKDVIRTHPDLRFFLEPKEDLGQKRYAALERILFVWAKLNKGVRYVQGMNEIVGTLYFVLNQDDNTDWSNEAEADTYFLFNALMVEMRDVFVPDLDDADTGIHGRISNMITLLSLHDPEVRCHLDSVGIDPSFYSVRWLTTLLSREFLLPDTIRLWDSMFASTHKDNFLRYVSVSMVMVIRDQLLCGDFSDCLRLLQAYPPTNLDRLLESSRALWIYESQITLACHKGGISLGHALRSINPPPAIIMAYGLQGGVAPPIREQVREAGKRGMEVARGAARQTQTAGRSFFGNAVNYFRGGSNGSSSNTGDKDVRRSKSTM